MSNYLSRVAHFAFRRRRLVLALWLVAAIAAIAIGVSSGGKTNDSFTIPGTEAQNAANVLSAKLPAFSGAQSTIVFATTHGSARVIGSKVWYHPSWFAKYVSDPDIEGQRLEHTLAEGELTKRELVGAGTSARE